MNKFAQFISIISHPILLPTWMFLIFITSGICKVALVKTGICLAVVFGTTFIMPILLLLVFKKFKVIESLTMEKKEERFIPLFIMVIALFTTSRFFNGIIPLALYNFYLICNLLICVIVFWINLWWKISMHGTGWGAFSATIFILSTISVNIFLPYLIISLLLSGLVGSSRLYLKSHSNSQIYAGFAVGFIIPLIIYNLL